MDIDLNRVPRPADADNAAALLFSESNTRFLCEVRPEQAAAFESAMVGMPHAAIGEVTTTGRLEILWNEDDGVPLVRAEVDALKEAWQKPLRW